MASFDMWFLLYTQARWHTQAHTHAQTHTQDIDWYRVRLAVSSDTEDLISEILFQTIILMKTVSLAAVWQKKVKRLSDTMIAINVFN